MILFDTDVCIELLRGNKKVLKKRSECDSDIGISFMTIAELYYGAENSSQVEKNTELIEKFFLTVQLIHTDPSILKKFGELKSSLKNQNALLPDADIFIAATALTKSEKLITANTKHFLKFEGLKIENWII